MTLFEKELEITNIEVKYIELSPITQDEKRRILVALKEPSRQKKAFNNEHTKTKRTSQTNSRKPKTS